MRTRSRAAGAAALCAVAWLTLPATGRAAECVQVVVDYGTVDGYAPGAPNTRCVNVDHGGTAAQALDGRARYKGNFLCAIDGYPESGCGDEPPSPYWSIWYWSGGRWVYSQEGVATLQVADRDRDGHPDAFGFRYHEVDRRQPPRLAPSYPKPSPTATPKPTATKPRSARPSATAPPATTGARPTANGSTAATSDPAVATTTTSGAPTATPATGVPTAPPTTTPPPAGDTGSPDAAPPPTAATPRGAGGVPVGTVAGALLAATLLGAAAVRARKSA